jgi:hypothetical protein
MSELTKTEAMRQVPTEDAADLLGVNPVIMETWRRKGIGPSYIRINQKCVRYRLGDLADFQDDHLVEGAA